MAKLSSDQLKRITSEAQRIRKAAGMVTVQRYKMPWREAIQKASKSLSLTTNSSSAKRKRATKSKSKK